MRAAITFVLLTSVALLSRASAQSAAPDVVETIRGDFYRGTIVERVVGDHVTIVLLSGATITVAWSEVTRADRNVDRHISTPPSSDAPERPSPDKRGAIGPRGQSVRPGVRTVSVRVRAADARQRLELLLGHDSVLVPGSTRGRIAFSDVTIYMPRYRTLCTGDCALELVVGGTYSFNVDPGDGSNRVFVPRTRRFRITERTIEVAIDYRSRRVQRVRRGIAISVVPVFGAVLMASARRSGARWWERRVESCEFETRNQAMFWSGVVLATSPVMTFMLPIFTRDRALIRVTRAPR
jgi:hypothetical protein